MSDILDHLNLVDDAVPGLAARVAHNTIGTVGHSLGGLTASKLLGAQVIDPLTAARKDHRDARISAGVLLSTPGRGGDALSDAIPPFFSFLSSIDCEPMIAPTLVIAGDKDQSRHLTNAGPGWHADPYHLALAPKTLLTLLDGEHQLGGISGYDATETTDDNPERVTAAQWLSWAYVRTELGGDANAWATSLNAFPPALGRVQPK